MRPRRASDVCELAPSDGCNAAAKSSDNGMLARLLLEVRTYDDALGG